MHARNAVTLAELVVVLAVLAALSGIAIPLYSGTVHDAYDKATQASLTEIRDAVNQYWSDTKYVVLDGTTTVATESQRFEIRWLFKNPRTGDKTVDYDPNTRLGWNGPYIAVSTGDPIALGGPALIDSWNHVIVLQDVDSTATPRDVRIVSGGPNGVVDIPSATATDSLTTSDVGDDIYVALSLR